MITKINEYKKYLEHNNFTYDNFDITIKFNDFVDSKAIDGLYANTVFEYQYIQDKNELTFFDVTDPDMDIIYPELDDLVGEDNYEVFDDREF